MAEKLYLYPKWLRFWHWINAALFLILIATGLSMQYSGPDYPVIPFELSVRLHNICGVLLTIFYIFFFIGNRWSGNRKHYELSKGFMDRATIQLRYYTGGIFKNEPHPFKITMQNKFNPLQRLTYFLTMYVGMPLIIITGWAMMFPEITFEKVFGRSGLLLTDQLHIVIGFFLSLFLMVHIYFATITEKPGANFKAMMNGWHEE